MGAEHGLRQRERARFGPTCVVSEVQTRNAFSVLFTSAMNVSVVKRR